MFAVVRIRGRMNVNKKVEDTMKMMRLNHANNCVILPENPDVKGMLFKSKDYVTWGEVTEEALAKMLEKRLRAKGNEKKVDLSLLKQTTKFDSFHSLASAIVDGNFLLHKHETLQPTFRLTPPSKGLKSVNETYPRGDLGYRGKEINELIERMI